MAEIRPFKGFRPKKGVEGKVASYPYDVINSQEAREIAKGNEYSFLHVVKPEIDLPENADLYGDEVYQKGADNLRKMIADGVLVQDDAPCLYIYSQQMKDHFQTGIVCLASAKEYDAGKIKKHEKTRTEKVIDRTKHIKVQGAHAGPVFLTYKAKDSIDKMVKDIQKNEPEYDVTFEDGFRHVLWVVKDQNLISQLIGEFKDIDSMYIADGHHRSESAAENFRQEQTEVTEGYLAVAFPDRELYIMDYNRAVKDLNGLTSADFLAKLKERFEVEDGASGWDGKPTQRHTFGLYLDKKWYKLTIKSEFVNEADPVKRLDSHIITENLLSPILNIVDLKTDKRIDFIGGIRGMKELEKIVDNGKFQFSISMYPTSIQELMDIADADEMMPPKSTWFEPKLRSGYVVNVFK
ncbi:MAG: DUF1015 family protein [Spirochaetes bacterium]|nr:DUF1015 family protein [Spirochaetota bacterium]